MIQRTILTAVTATLLILGSTVLAAESRSHFAAMGPGRVPVYKATLITNLNEHESQRTLLLENMHGERLVISNLRSYANQTDVYSFKDGAGSIIFSASIAFPLDARTQSETVTELREIQRRGRAFDLPIELRTGKSVHMTKESDWSDEIAATRLRGELRRELPAGFVAELARAKSLFAAPELSDFCLILAMVEQGVCGRDNALRVAYTTPDCAFDASFGNACSPEQESRAATATTTLKVGHY